MAAIINRIRSRGADRRLVADVPWLAGLPDAQLGAVASIGTPLPVEEGKALTREGTVGREAFLVLDGHATVEVGGQVVARVGPGSFVGEMALLDHEPRTATVVAATAMTMLAFDPRAFGDFVSATAPAHELHVQLVARLRKVLAQ